MSQCGFSVMEYGYASLKVADRRISRVVCDGNFRIGRELQQANVVFYCQTMYRRQFLFFFTQHVSHPLFLTELIDNEG